MDPGTIAAFFGSGAIQGPPGMSPTVSLIGALGRGAAGVASSRAYQSITSQASQPVPVVSAPRPVNPSPVYDGSGAFYQNQGLLAGEGQRSGSGAFTVVLQADGNVVLYGPAGAYWATHTDVATTQGNPGEAFVLQGDGNLVLYDGYGNALWATHTEGSGGNVLAVQDDGNLVIYGPSGAIWGSRSDPGCIGAGCW
jgi:hypothetical protein